eukprot:5146426-Pyramimonas_sp.AAC.1
MPQLNLELRPPGSLVRLTFGDGPPRRPVAIGIAVQSNVGPIDHIVILQHPIPPLYLAYFRSMWPKVSDLAVFTLGRAVRYAQARNGAGGRPQLGPTARQWDRA